MKLEDIDTQDKLDELINKTVEESVEGLVKKNKELLGKLSKAKEIPDNLDELIQAKETLEELQSKTLEEQGDYKKLFEQTKEQHEKSLNEMKDKLEKEIQQNRDLLVHDGLSRSLAKHNINPVLLDAAVNLLSPEISLVEADGKRVAQVGDKSIDDYVTDWSNSDVGKNFVLSSNSGGGGNGNEGGKKDTSEWETAFRPETKNITRQAQLYKEDPALYDQYVKKYG